jgi:hypothetical protein
MTLSEQQVISEVRTITGYPDAVLTDSDLTELVSFAKNDITGITNNYDIKWYNEDDIDANRALVWTTALFTKVRTGELDAAEYSLEELDITPDTAAGAENGGRPLIWYRKVWDFIDDIRVLPDDDNKTFGITEVERENRQYGNEQQSGGLGGQ